MRFNARAQISAMAVVATIILAVSMVNVSYLGGPQSGLGVSQGQPTDLYPVVVTLGTGEKIFLATHTSDLAGGNWIELSGGTPIALPSLTLIYEGPDNASYTKEGKTVTIESDFTQGQATYPLTNHSVYTAGQSISSTFWGATALQGESVDFKLLSLSSISEIREILEEAFLGDLDPLRDKLSSPTWSATPPVTLNGTGDETVNIPSQTVGDYLLVVVKEIAGPPYELYIYSATVVEVVDYTLQVSATSSVEKGDDLNVNLELISATPGTYIYSAVMIKESAYSGEIKLLTNGTVLGTELYLNVGLMADGTFASELVLGTMDEFDITEYLGDLLLTALKSNEITLGFTIKTSSTTGSTKLSTSSLATGNYILLVGVWSDWGSRLIGLNQLTIKVFKPYEPPPKNKPPVADAGSDQKVYVGNVTHFSGAGSYDPDGKIVSYSWRFGEGTTASGIDVSHTYSEKGRYTVTLTVEDNKGSKGHDTCVATVKEIPIPVPILNETEDLVPAGETGYVVNASAEADTTVTLNTTDQVNVTVTRYEENPYPEGMPEAAVPKYIDVSVSDPDAVEWPIYVEITYTDDEIKGINEDSLGIYYWREGAWHRCSDTGVDTERNVVWAYMTREELWGSPLILGGTWTLKPAEFEISDLTIEPPEIEAMEEVTIGFTVTNLGEEPGNYAFTLRIEGPLLLGSFEITGALGALKSETRSYSLKPDTPGVYIVEVDGLKGDFEVKAPKPPPEPAEFEASNLLVTPSEVVPGVTVTVSATVTNIGEEFGSHTVELKLDGAVVDSESIALDGGDSATISFTTSSEEEGIHTVEVDGLSGSFTVKAPPLPPKKPLVNSLISPEYADSLIMTAL